MFGPMRYETYNVRGVDLMKPVAFPHITKFSELFDQYTSDESRKPEPRYIDGMDYELRTGKDIPVHEPVGPYCSTSRLGDGDYHSLYVRCTDAILDEIQRNMLVIKYDSIYFEIIGHDNGLALVVAKYNQIIGDRWLAYIDADSVPIEESNG